MVVFHVSTFILLLHLAGGFLNTTKGQEYCPFVTLAFGAAKRSLLTFLL